MKILTFLLNNIYGASRFISYSNMIYTLKL